MQSTKKILTNIAFEYSNYARFFLVSFLIFIYLFIFFQSYIAEPRSFGKLWSDMWDFGLFFLIIIYVFWRGKVKNLLIFGMVFLIISILMFLKVIDFIKLPYGTLSFLCALWFLGDYFNIKKFGKSIFTELLKGNYYMALGLLISTVIVGALVEIVNIPFKIWQYQWPFPSVEIGGLPVILVSFGWTPWVLAMFVFLYPFALKKPNKLNIFIKKIKNKLIN